MAFSPIWQPGGAAAPASPAATRQIVTGAAHRLQAAIAEAARRTDDWQDQRLGYALIDSALSNCLAQLATTGHWGRENLLPSDELWKIAGEVLQTGELQNRARTKPLGYAGDFQLLADIVDDRCGDHPLGRLFDRYFLNQAAPQAVRNRTVQGAFALADHVAQQKRHVYRIASVGVGTGMDVQMGVSMLPAEVRTRVEATLIDLDAAGLQFAKNRLLEVIGENQINATRENLFRITQTNRNQVVPADTDFLICSGLFDYLEDNVATAMLKLFWDSLADGGLLLVGNFVPYHPTRAYMEWIGNWYLQYRTPVQLSAMAAAAGIPDPRRMVLAERTGADLFLRCEK
ncbi:MAG: hypothetical protein GTO53_06030 [Planctomycetales bacterium]|nr:hypothetical protein [Planctomycetales bacterium]NIM08703.1 hypothetical protein [Planctomycetales bacterium]NIN08173.1 hypothetical protein [Planctomycetales bacterium]NIN77302.1 hypothetical protein [Planctomycetales bacterium]NIO34488.1 hypothetical protein [Planctomycetales bacterium]